MVFFYICVHQVLAEYKQKSEFNNLLKRYEEKPACENRTLEIFLTYPMHQVSIHTITRYVDIILPS